jgi:tRNA A-37 threonylcarbamoyl transferase component Bud32
MNEVHYLDYYNYNESDESDEEKIMYGGELIDEGGYGCVYYPALNCNKKKGKNKKYISKVQLETTVSSNELNIGKKIQKIKNYKNYFSPVIESCPLKVNNQINDCNLLKKHNNKKIIMMKSIYIPNTLFINYFNKLQKKYKLNNFLFCYKYLLNSLKKLVKNKIIHFDLKGNNILVDKNTEIPIIIDFGLSFDVSKLNNKNIEDKLIYSDDYILWSPEIVYLSYLYKVNEKPTLEEIENITNNIFKTLEDKIFVNYYSQDFIIKLKEVYKLALLKYKNYSKEDMYEYIFNNNNIWKTIDNYSLSIIYFRLFTQIFNNFNNEFIIYFSKILLNNIHPFPEKRYDLDTTYNLINNLFYVNQNINMNELMNYIK